MYFVKFTPYQKCFGTEVLLPACWWFVGYWAIWRQSIVIQNSLQRLKCNSGIFRFPWQAVKVVYFIKADISHDGDGVFLCDLASTAHFHTVPTAGSTLTRNQRQFLKKIA
jgi:hypothetical protein